MLTLTVDRAGLSSLSRDAAGLRELGQLDYSEFFERYLEPDFEATQAEQFDSEGARGEAGQWVPLSPLYAQIKSEHFPGKPIMQLTGRLKDSYVKRGSPDAFRRLTPTSFERDTTVPYAPVHNDGSDRRMWIPAPFSMWINGVPRRSLLGVRDTDVQRWADRLGEWVAAERLPRILGGA